MRENHFSSNIIALRKQRNLTTGLVAQTVKIPEETIISWELGVAEPEIKDIMRMAKLFNVDASDLVNTPLYATQVQPQQQVVQRRVEPQPSYPTQQTQSQVVYNAQPKEKAKSTHLDPPSKKFMAMQIVVMILSAITFMLFATPLFIIEYTDFSITFFDVLTPDEFVFETICFWFVFLVIVYNIVNSIMLLSSNTLRTSKYKKISQVIMLSTNAAAFVFWIMACIDSEGLEFGFCGGWLFIVFIAIVVFLMIANIKSKPIEYYINQEGTTVKMAPTTAQNSTTDAYGTVVKRNRSVGRTATFFGLAGTALLGLVIATIVYLFVPMAFEYKYQPGGSSAYWYGSKNILLIELSGLMLPMIIIIALMTMLILLMINKIRNKPKARKGLGIISIILSVLVLPVAAIGCELANEQVWNMIRDFYNVYLNFNAMTLMAIFAILASFIALAASIVVLTIKNQNNKDQRSEDLTSLFLIICLLNRTKPQINKQLTTQHKSGNVLIHRSRYGEIHREVYLTR